MTLLLLACVDGPAAESGPADTGSPDTADTDSGADSGSDSDSGDTDTDTDTGVAFDPLTLAGLVSADQLGASIAALQDFGTRHTDTPGNGLARAWIADQLTALGLAPEEDPFEAKKGSGTNVIARLDGRDVDRIWIYSAHFDSTSDAWNTRAPGADDNASGVAAVLEAARILRDVPLQDSVWFVATDAEELGSLGSAHLADRLVDEGWDVQGVIAPDMIGYWPLGDGDAFDILGDDGSAALVADMSAVADALGVAHKTWIEHDYCYGDDHTSFQDAGFPALSPMDCVEAHNVPASGEDTPHYHRTSDTLETVHLPFTAKVAGVVTASLGLWATHGELP